MAEVGVGDGDAVEERRATIGVVRATEPRGEFDLLRQMWACIKEVALAVSGIDSQEAGHEPLERGIDACGAAALAPASDLRKTAVLRGSEHDHVGLFGATPAAVNRDAGSGLVDVHAAASAPRIRLSA